MADREKLDDEPTKEEKPSFAISPDLMLLFVPIQDLPAYYGTWVREKAKLN